ncbi:Lactoylglutathione lyase [Porphyridium purpureum]|uniref:lactoylglutathione lyase n=1 Tax=Porphyridium purpureum TaxID=35688 RepID=A0A5J4YTA0_PORPP|nr:Lactoylglutathione lyase [Porphyridium purpureum]|eukprot:POR9108..scf227_4
MAWIASLSVHSSRSAVSVRSLVHQQGHHSFRRVVPKQYRVLMSGMAGAESVRAPAAPGRALGWNPVFAQTMLRAKSHEASRRFYEDVLGMTFLTELPIPEFKFSLMFFAYTDEAPVDQNASRKERGAWLFTRPYPTIELTHNFGTETQEGRIHHNGNSDPKGYGHIGIFVDDVAAAWENAQRAGAEVVKAPSHVAGLGTVAYIADPDGYYVALVNRTKGSAKHPGKCKGVLGADPVLAHTMLRTNDPAKAVQYYENLGLKLVGKVETNEVDRYYMALTDKTPADPTWSAEKQAEFLGSQRYPMVELVYEKDADHSKPYHNGNTDPRGFGHIGFTVDDMYKTVEVLEANGVECTRRPGPFADDFELAFVKDHDGYLIELINRKPYNEPMPYEQP